MRKITLSIVFLIIGIQSFSQDVNKLALNNKQDILQGRLWLSVPDSAKNIARGVDVMSHDPNAQKETRIVFNNGSEMLVLFAQELFLIGNDHLLQTLQGQQDENFGFKYAAVSADPSLVTIEAIASKWDTSRNGILINSTTVMTKDSCIMRIDAYINPEAYRNQKDNYIQLSQNVFKTLKAGTRLNDLKAKKESHKIFGSEKSFVFDLPSRYAIQIDQKYDFQVFRIKKFERIGDSTWQNASIYVGDHPSAFYGDYGFEAYTEKQMTDFLDTQTEWYYFVNEEEQVYLKEQQIEYPALGEGTMLHVAISGNSEEVIQEQENILKKVKME